MITLVPMTGFSFQLTTAVAQTAIDSRGDSPQSKGLFSCHSPTCLTNLTMLCAISPVFAARNSCIYFILTCPRNFATAGVLEA